MRSRWPLAALVTVTLVLGLFGGGRGGGVAHADHSHTGLLSVSQITGSAGTGSFRGASVDGSRVFFRSSVPLVSADTDGQEDIYQRSGGVTTLISAAQPPAPGNAAFIATFKGASADGTRVFFETFESLVSGDTDNSSDVYERSGGTTTLISAAQPPAVGNGAFAVLFVGASVDGGRVFFRTDEQLTSDDSTDSSIDVYVRENSTTTLISAAEPPAVGNGAFGATFNGASADGGQVFFTTTEALASGDTDGLPDIYERLLSSGVTRRVSTGLGNGNGAATPTFKGASADGTRVFFETIESLVVGEGDSNSVDVYERSGSPPSTKLISTGSAPPNSAVNATFQGASADGTRVFFETTEKLTTDDSADSSTDVYERMGTTTTTLISAGQVAGSGNGPDNADFAGASADGTRVFFHTTEVLTSDDTDGVTDVYERSGGVTTRISAGQLAGSGNGGIGATFDGASADGTRVFFHTVEKLVTDDTDNVQDVYERSGGVTTRVSLGQIGGNGANAVIFDGASTDGTRVFFQTTESLTSGDTNGVQDIYEATVETVAFTAAASAVNESGGTASLTVDLLRPAPGAVTVDYAVTGGTAQAGDFSLPPGTLTYTPGQVSKTIAVGITQDQLDESAETVVVTLSNPVNTALGATTTHTLGITDDDATVGFTAASSVVGENAGTATVTVQATGGITGNMTVDYAVTGGTATAGTDFTLAAGTLSFGVGATSQTLVVGITQDTSDEAVETVVVTLSNVTGPGELGTATHTLGIADDDATVGFSAAGSSAGEGAGTASVTVDATGGITGNMTVDYAITGGTATPGGDFTLASGTLSFGVGDTSKAIVVAITQDLSDEAAETVVITLSNVTGQGQLGTASHTLGITDDDAVVRLTSTDSVAAEGAAAVAVIVEATDGITGPVTVDYAVTGGTAAPGSDFTLPAGTLTFNVGDISKTIAIAITQDTTDEVVETVVLTLSNVTGQGQLGAATHTLAIADDDAVVGFTTESSTASEGAGTVNVALEATRGISGPVAVDYAVTGGSATGGSDFTLAAGTLTFNVGDTSKTIAIAITQDDADEPDENVVVTLSNVTGQAQLGTAAHTLAITDDDAAAVDNPTVGFGKAASKKGEGGKTVTVAVTLNKAATGPVTVKFGLGRGTATNGKDFTLAAGTLTFAAGQVSKTFTITLKQDFLVENAETVVLKLASPTGAVLRSGSHTFSITDDEPRVKCGGNNATIVGSNGNDTLTGTAGVDVIVGRGGKDTMKGLGGKDVLCGSGGDDTIKGGGADDVMDAGSGNDILNGDAGNDALAGGSGNDTLKGDAGTDSLKAGGGKDGLAGGAGAGDACDGGNGVDVLLPNHGCETTAAVPGVARGERG